MIICVCHRISDRDIARTVRDGCASFDELQFELAVATRCGKCHDSARETFDAHRAQVAAGGQAAERCDAAGRHRHRVIPIASHPHHDRAASATA
jgi:bacterioferritin-associated ferredoxin